jgi:predicted dithiol-disulfide oxidoreductase (DUF899 family)
MTPRIATRAEWLAARCELLAAEKELTHRSDDVARQRQALPWVPIAKDYRFETVAGERSLAGLFDGRSQLLVHHFMYPGCPSCSSVADGYNGFAAHLGHHDVTLTAISRYPLAELTAYRERMGWTFPWASSLGSDFNFDFGVAYSDEMIASGRVQHNLHETWDWADTPREPFRKWEERPPKDLPGVSAFVREDSIVYHTYSAYARGTDILWGLYQWLDRAPNGRNEPESWIRLKDSYD